MDSARSFAYCRIHREDRQVTPELPGDVLPGGVLPAPVLPGQALPENKVPGDGHPSEEPPPTVLDAVIDLRRDAAAAGLPLAIEGVEAARASRERLLDQLDNHLIPRLRELTAPALVVLAGPTGSGKSTLVNSIVGTEVSPAGVLRPTTRKAVLVHHPLDADVLAKHPLLASVDVVASEKIPRGIILVDAPDMDSISEANRDMSRRLLEAADLWLFLTTSNRYGDAIPWQHLSNAQERGASVALVLNRVESRVASAVRTDLTGRLVEAGMSDIPVFLIPDAGALEGILTGPAIEAIARWLAMVAGPDRAKQVVQRTLRGALNALKPWVDDLAEAVQLQVDARDALRTIVRTGAEPARQLAIDIIGQNALADGGVQARWAAMAGPGGLLHIKRTRRGIKGTRMSPQKREDEQRELVWEIDRAVQVGVQNIGLIAEEDIRAALGVPDAPTGAQALLADVDKHEEDARRRKDARLLAGGWLDEISATVSASRDDTSKADHFEDVCLAIGQDSVSAVVASAAIGLTAAESFLREFTGSHGADLVDPVRERLIERLEGQALREARTYTGIVDGAGLADDAAAGLRVRLAVLKDLV